MPRTARATLRPPGSLATNAMSRRFYIVDVFAERPYAGNQLAVVVDAADLSSEAMQQIALETNYSETTS